VAHAGTTLLNYNSCISFAAFYTLWPQKSDYRSVFYFSVYQLAMLNVRQYYHQGLKNAVVCSSVKSENFESTGRKFNRAVPVQSVQFSFYRFFLQLIRKLNVFGINEQLYFIYIRNNITFYKLAISQREYEIRISRLIDLSLLR
jgi:hypothetical protein